MWFCRTYTRKKAQEFLKKSGVQVLINTKAIGCDENTVLIDSGVNIKTNMIIWTAGIKGNLIDGLKSECYSKSGRIIVDRYNKVNGYENIYALGDISFMTEEKYLKGHPQVGLGTMATIGNHLAVVELPYFHFQGVFAWFVWMFIHLMSIVGVRNKLLIFMNWAWKYFTYDQSTRLILRPKGYS